MIINIHPILIQSTHMFTKLLFDYEYRRLFHAGPQLLLASIREPIGLLEDVIWLDRVTINACYASD